MKNGSNQSLEHKNKEAYRNFYISLSSKTTKRIYNHILKKFIEFLDLENDPLKYQKLAEYYDSKTLENIVIDYIIKRTRHF